jgi:hypothetical protein
MAKEKDDGDQIMEDNREIVQTSLMLPGAIIGKV